MSYALEALDSLGLKDGYYTGEIYFPWFDVKCSFVLEDFPGEVPEESCLLEIQAFLDWGNSLREKLEEASRRYALYICREHEEESAPYNSSTIINAHCYPGEVSLLIGDKGSVVNVELECDWEEEHGMCWLVQNGKDIAYVGPFDGTSLAFALAHPEEPMNFAGHNQVNND